MPCSRPTGKSGRWLDRLRAAKGFPESDAADLERFLQNPSRPPAEQPEQKTKPYANPIALPPRNPDRDLRNVVTGVLSELFNFGDRRFSLEKLTKSSRKQINPRICTFSNQESSNGALEMGKLWKSDDSGSGVEGAKELDSFENEEDGGDRDDGGLVGFSRTEVTVIDTSYGGWKFEKLLYRKKNVWKARDKKGKSAIFLGKKRKLNAGVDKGKKSRNSAINETEGHEKDYNNMGSCSTANKHREEQLKHGNP